MRILLNNNDFIEEQLAEYKKEFEWREFVCSPTIDTLPFLEKKEIQYKTPDTIRFIKLNALFGAYFVAYVCPKCYCEILGYWKGYTFWENNNFLGVNNDLKKVRTDIENKFHISEEIKKAENLTECPCCGSELLSDNLGYHRKETGWSWLISEDTPDSVFRSMREYRNRKEYEYAKQKTDNYIALCNSTVMNSISSNIIASVKNDPVKLQEYVSNLINLEVGIYGLQKRLADLYAEQINMEHMVISERYGSVYERKTQLKIAKENYNDWQEKIQQYARGDFGILKPAIPKEPIMQKPTLLNKKKVLEQNEKLRLEYQKKVADYERNTQSYEAEIALLTQEANEEVQKIELEIEQLETEYEKSLQTAENSSELLSAQSLIDTEVLEAENLLKKLYESKNKLYSYNIVFDKYRNMVALSTFYEYLMAGRCTTLEGANGAYNIYEQEIRADKIIGQLDDIINCLEDIAATQFMIYKQMRMVNSSLDKLNRTMSEMLISTKNIEYNTERTAYYSKLNADLTNSLGFMIALS